MIRFEKYATNNVVVTLTENSTLTNPFYLFQFTNQTSNVDYYFIATDVSLYKTNLVSLAGLTNASQAVSSATLEVEKGKVWVVPSSDANYIYNGIDTTAIVYNPDDNLLTEDGYYILQENGFLLNI